ncbi:hypothetical protein BCR35DRAFT_333627 [Leucosporidium creatinivorum]|uniref:RING-type domain-containing protein n=1 Tax=Leucosporidium creatinivorum TaxID=106004 RepID=A0A1Y2EQ07_9BASI|nr:hypothetical protein BCR35DRAFT_333627 [Leucosporidium creatinivorum]
MSTLSRQASTTPALDVGSAGPSVPRAARRAGASTSNARAGPSNPTTTNSNVIDLTSSSPPTSHRALAGPSTSNGLRLPAPAPAPRRGGLRARAAGPSGSGTRVAAEVIELSSDEEDAVVLDDDSDGEIVVAGGRAGPSRLRANGSAASSNSSSRVQSAAARDRYRAGQDRMVAEARNAAQIRRDERLAAQVEDDEYWRAVGFQDGYAAGGSGAAPNYGGGGGTLGLAALLGMAGSGVAGGVGGSWLHHYGSALLGYVGDGVPVPGGLQGLYGGGGAGNSGWGGAERVKKGKKYGVRMSHPQKIEEGFTRDILELPDPDDPPPPPAKRKKGSKTTSNSNAEPELLEPVCSSCLEPLLLAQSGSQRPWALRCGHVVCGGCIGSARKRVEEVKRKEREIVLGSDDEMDVGGGRGGGESDGELKYVGDSSSEDDAEEEEDDTAITGRRRPRRATNSKAKTKNSSSRAKPTPASATKPTAASKGKAKSLPTDVDSSWTTCPIVSCAGDKTDLGKEVGEGAVEGAWELFV